MRTLMTVLAICFVLTALPAGAAPIPDGQILAKDPQLMQTWWISQATNERVNDRDVFVVERDGRKVTEAIVVNVLADHSVVMARNAVNLEKGDVVRFVRHSADPRDTVATTPAKGYKIVGGHSLVFTSGFSANPIGTNPTFSVPVSSVSVTGLATGIQGFSLQSTTNFGNNLSFGTSLGVGNSFSLPTFSSNSGFHTTSSWSIGGF